MSASTFRIFVAIKVARIARIVSKIHGIDITETTETEGIAGTEIDTKTSIEKGKRVIFRNICMLNLYLRFIYFRDREEYGQKKSYFDENEENPDDHKGGLSNQDKDLYAARLVIMERID